MEIYELIYYYDDVCDGADITESYLTIDPNEVDLKIQEFIKSMELEYDEVHYDITNHEGYVSGSNDENTSNLLIKKHSLNVKTN